MEDPETILYPTFGKFMGLGDLREVVGINADSGSELSSPAINIEVAPVKDAEFNCPICGLQTRKAGFEHDNREWRHVDFLPAKTLVHCRRPRVSCPIHGVQQVEAPFERKHSRFTLLFEALAVYLARDMPCRKVGELLRVDGETISAIVQHWVLKAVEKDDLSKVKSIAIDETSFKKKHKYVTVVIDSDTKRVIDVEAGKDSAAVDKFAVKLVKKGGDNEE
jgi:transposase